MTEKPIAEQYFDAHCKAMSLEDDVIEAVLSVLGFTSWPHSMFNDITFDWYDASFELKNVFLGYDINKAALKACGELGFARCWLCYTDGTEKYYVF